MIRALSSLIVVCLVAATGVRPVAAVRDPRSAWKAPRAVETLHARVVEAGALGRLTSHVSGASGPSANARAPWAPEPTAIVVAGALAFAAPDACSIGQLAGGPPPVISSALSTRSARGPPVV